MIDWSVKIRPNFGQGERQAVAPALSRPALSPERIGKITASRAKEIKYLKDGKTWTPGAETYLGELIWMHITGEDASAFSGSAATEWGSQHESSAIDIFEKKTGLKGRRNEFIRLEGSKLIGCTPDWIGNKYFAETKCPYAPKTHFKTFLEKNIPDEYIDQVRFQCLVSGLKKGYFISYDPRLPEKYGYIQIEYKYEKSEIAELKSRLLHFEETLFDRLRRLEIEPRL